MFDVFSNDFRLIFRQSRLVTSTPCSRVLLQQQQRQPRFLARNLGGNFQADVNQLDSIISVYSTLNQLMVSQIPEQQRKFKTKTYETL